MGKVMFVPMLSMGHLNVGLTAGKMLQAKFNGEHEFVILTDIRFESKLQKMCPFAKLRIYTNPILPKDFDSSKDIDPTIRLMDEFAKTFEMPNDQRFDRQAESFTRMADNWKAMQPEIESIIADERPDFIFFDNLFPLPFLMNKSIPWGVICSANPLFVKDPNNEIPPCGSGLTSSEADRTKREAFLAKHAKDTKLFHEFMNKWLVESQTDPLPKNCYLYGSSYLNVYLYPKEVDYFDLPDSRLPGQWVRVDSTILSDEIMNKLGEKQLQLDVDLNLFSNKDPKRKTIYFSLGSLVSSQSQLLQRIVDMLGTIEHNFVVSKGARGDQLKMPPNCIGKNYLVQTKLLPHVQLAIVHGGNNTFTECFHYGVPMIIMPVFGDQPDNAARVQELGIGRWLNLFTCTRDELAEAIDSLLSKPEVEAKMTAISKRICADNGWNAFCDALLPFLNKSQQSAED